MRVCTKCLCANAGESMAAAYEMLGWRSPESLRPGSLDIDRLRRLGCSCGEFPDRGLSGPPEAGRRHAPRGMRATSAH